MTLDPRAQDDLRTENARLCARIAELERFERLVEVLPFGVVILGVESAEPGDLRFSYANPKATGESALDLRAFMGKTVREVLPDNFESGDDAAHVGAFRRAIETGDSGALQFDRGARGWFHMHCLRVDDRHVASVYQNITAAKEAEKALRESEARFRQLSDAMPQVVWTAEPDGAIDYYNQRWLDYTGMTLEQTLACGWGPVVHPDDLKLCLEEWANALSTGATYEVKCRFKRALDGGYRWHLGRALPIRDERGAVTKWLGTCTDIDDQIRAEAVTLRSNEELERLVEQRTAQLVNANRELQSFSYAVAHDLWAPLRGMSGFAEVLRADYGDKLDEAGHDCIREIQQNASKMGELIDALLMLSRVTRSDVVPKLVDFGALVRAVVKGLAEAEPRQGLELVVHENLNIELDPQLARALAEILVTNAWKFTGKVPASLIEAGVKIEKGNRHFFVRDNGAGFDMAYASKLFVPFERLHTVAEFPGTGVGLATAQRIIQRHGGRIWAEGNVNAGATFYFALPEKALGAK